MHLWLTHDEETNAAGAWRWCRAGRGPAAAGCCMVGEPTGMAPVIAHKGYASWDVTVTGLSGHSSRTTETANALQAAAECVGWLCGRARAFATEGRRVAGFEPPLTTVHVGTFQAGSVLNIVPDRADFIFEVRTVPGDDAAAVLRRVASHSPRSWRCRPCAPWRRARRCGSPRARRCRPRPGGGCAADPAGAAADRAQQRRQG